MQNDINQIYSIHSRPKKKRIWLIFLFAAISIIAIFSIKTGFILDQIQVSGVQYQTFKDFKPQKDDDRVNILLLGIRGANDIENGGLLSDSIILLSIKKSAKKVALISLPRDIYAKIPEDGFRGKINTAYVIGEEKEWDGGGLKFSKRVAAYVGGVYIDDAISVNFDAFKELIDNMGGVTVYLDKPFVEDKQWWCDENGKNCGVFSLPAGQNNLNSEKALFYVRSRFSSNDFDRDRRQQEVLFALKDKIFSLNMLANPIKLFEILNTMGKNVRIDFDANEIKNLVILTKDLDFRNPIKKVFDITPEGLLYESRVNDQYVLLPRGDNFENIRKTVREIFDTNSITNN